MPFLDKRQNYLQHLQTFLERKKQRTFMGRGETLVVVWK